MISTLLNWVFPLFHFYGYRILFIAAFLEALPFIGVVVPGATLAVFAGFIVRRGVIHFFLAFLFLGLGAFIGDTVNYLIGRHFGYAFIKKYGKYIFLTEGRLETIRNHIKNNRGKTLILGRFTSFTRSVAPFAAGASHIDFLPFLGYTFISAFSWSFTHLLIGFIFGKWFEKITHYLGFLIIFAILVGFGLVYVYRFIDQRHHVFKKLHVYTLLTMIFSLFIFSSVLQGVLNDSWILDLNHYIAVFALSIQRPWLTEIMINITNLGGLLFVSILAIFLVIYLLSKKRVYMASLVVSSLILGEILMFVLKEVINLPRPTGQLVQTFLPAFPSGHATAVVVLGSLIFLAFIGKFKTKWGKYLFFLADLLCVLLICFSRIYLNVHWTADIIAGISLGFFSVSFTILVFRLAIFAKKWFY